MCVCVCACVQQFLLCFGDLLKALLCHEVTEHLSQNSGKLGNVIDSSRRNVKKLTKSSNHLFVWCHDWPPFIKN